MIEYTYGGVTYNTNVELTLECPAETKVNLSDEVFEIPNADDSGNYDYGVSRTDYTTTNSTHPACVYAGFTMTGSGGGAAPGTWVQVDTDGKLTVYRNQENTINT